MSVLFSRISKLSVKNARFFSSKPQAPQFLYKRETLRTSSEGEKIVNHKLFDPRTEEIVLSREKTLPKELHGDALVGASKGWVVSMNKKDFSLHLTDLYNLGVSSPRVISLPKLGSSPSATVKLVSVSLSSSSPDQDQDFTVVAKFNESQLSVCKPNCDSEWTHFSTPFPLLEASSDLTYCKRDKAFYFPTSNGLYRGSLDLTSKTLKYKELRFHNLPIISEAEWSLLDTCVMTKHFVDSPSGEHFFVKWYRQCFHKENSEKEVEDIHSKTIRFMVFREDGRTGALRYTEDIGDLCFFLGFNEAFCVSASMYPGLKPNSIYYMGAGLGSYSLDSANVRPYNIPGESRFVSAPFWLHHTDRIST